MKIALAVLLQTLLIFLVITLPQPVRAQLYVQMASNCGSFPGSPVYPQVSYAQAQYDAGQALREAKSKGDTAGAAQIEAAANKIKNCEKLEAGKFLVLPYMDCDLFVSNFQQFERNVGLVFVPSRELNDLIDKGRKKLAEQAKQCLQELTSKCIDPTDTQAVLKAIFTLRVIVASGGADVVYSGSGSDLGNFFVRNNPFLAGLKFCTDTDYACNGSEEFCRKRVEMIQRFLNYGYKAL